MLGREMKEENTAVISHTIKEILTALLVWLVCETGRLADCRCRWIGL